MKNALSTAIRLCREPMIAVHMGKVRHLNQAAGELFHGIAAGRLISDFIADDVLGMPGGSFTTSLETDSGRLLLTVIRDGDDALMHFAGDRRRERVNFLSDALLSSLSSSLATAGLAIERLAEGITSDKTDERYLAPLNHSYYLLRHLIGNLSIATQLADDELSLSLRHINLALVCSNLVSTVALLTKSTGVELTFSTELGELYAVVDVEKLERVILNLIVNSLQHTDPGCKISVTLEKRGDKALITVRDNGSGIPPEILQNIFRRYHERIELQTLSSKPRPGLGLAISRGIAESHGGALIVDSAPGQEGTTIYFSLPLRPEGHIRFSSIDGEPPSPNMPLILGELSDILGSSFYTSTYLD